MDKEILFLWFGDEKPKYIEWTLENFREMNPDWNIKYIEYTTDQILHYKLLNDSILFNTIEKNNLINYKTDKLINHISDLYRMQYLIKNKDKIVVYCDLDCFPIESFNNFICNNIDIKWINEKFCFKHKIQTLGTYANNISNKNIYFDDIWCIANNNIFLFNRFLQIHKLSNIDDNLILHEGMLINHSNIKDYIERNKNFQNMKIKLGDNFCLTQFTPIEHYYCRERYKINKNILL